MPSLSESVTRRCLFDALSTTGSLYRNDPQGSFTMTRYKIGGSDKLDLILSWVNGNIHVVNKSDSSDS